MQNIGLKDGSFQLTYSKSVVILKASSPKYRTKAQT